MKPSTMKAQLWRLEAGLEELTYQGNCVDGTNLKCPMSNAHNKNSGYTAIFSIPEVGRNKKRIPLEVIEEKLQQLAKETGHTIEFQGTDIARVAKFYHKELNTENYTAQQVSEFITGVVRGWEDAETALKTRRNG